MMVYNSAQYIVVKKVNLGNLIFIEMRQTHFISVKHHIDNDTIVSLKHDMTSYFIRHIYIMSDW